jgi:hypothetical protein
LTKQCLAGIGDAHLRITELLAMAVAKCFSAAMVCFFGFGPPLLSVFNSFIPFTDFYL